jgi:hypothetical protein
MEHVLLISSHDANAVALWQRVRGGSVAILAWLDKMPEPFV